MEEWCGIAARASKTTDRIKKLTDDINTDTPFFCHTSAQFIKNLVTKSQLTDLTQQIKHGKNVLLLVMHMEKNRIKKKNGWDENPVIFLSHWSSGNPILSIITYSFLNNGNANRWKRELFRKPTQKEIANEKVIILGGDLYIGKQGEKQKAHIFIMNINVAMFATAYYCMVCLKSKKRVIYEF